MADAEYQPFPDIGAWTAVQFEPTTYEQYAALLEQARADANEEARDHAVRTAIRYAGTDTGAIEGLYTTDRGFTRTVAIEAAHWEAAANERGPNAAQVIKDQIEAYEWLLDLVTESRPVTESVIRELHAILCRSQETYTVHTEVGAQTHPLPKGEYKRYPNNPTSLATGQIHHYAPPDLVGPEVHRLVKSLSSDEYRNAHPVEQAAYLHYSLVAIHPFADGNGRTTRALASVPLYRALRVPLIVFADDRDEYLDTLAAADAGDLRAFVRFVEERVVDAAELVRATTRMGGRADLARSLAALHAARLTSGFTLAELEALGAATLDAVEDAARAHLTAAAWPDGVSWDLLRVDVDESSPAVPPTHRRAPQAGLLVTLESDPPAAAAAGVEFNVGVAEQDGEDPVLVVDPLDALPLSRRDVQGGRIRTVAKIKLDAWVAARLEDLVAFLAGLAAEARSRG